ncbi:MAG: hypothetical protein HDT41_01680 [Lachnospiraceae bacterium]|nr:hypothetical protein [Lachnospiraceae bacterium]
MKKRIFTTLFATVLAAGVLTGCGSQDGAKTSDTDDVEIITGDSVEVDPEEDGEMEENIEEDAVEIKGTITVAATATPHAEILEQAKPLLAAKGWDLEVTIFDDDVQPNLVVESGEFDANYFQHISYLDSFNEEQGTHLVNAGEIHYQSFGISQDTDSEEAKTYVNIIAVKEGNEENEGIKALVEVLKSDDIKTFIENTYDGDVVAFE